MDQLNRLHGMYRAGDGGSLSPEDVLADLSGHTRSPILAILLLRRLFDISGEHALSLLVGHRQWRDSATAMARFTEQFAHACLREDWVVVQVDPETDELSYALRVDVDADEAE